MDIDPIKADAIELYRLSQYLKDLSQLDIENLVGMPPRITRDALHLAAQRAAMQADFFLEDVGKKNCRFSTRSEMLIADELNAMLRAAWAKHWKEHSP